MLDLNTHFNMKLRNLQSNKTHQVKLGKCRFLVVHDIKVELTAEHVKNCQDVCIHSTDPCKLGEIS